MSGGCLVGSPRAVSTLAPSGAAPADTLEAPGEVQEGPERRDGSRGLNHGGKGGLEGGGAPDSARESAASSCAAGSRARRADFEGAPSAGRPIRSTPESVIGAAAPHDATGDPQEGGAWARSALDGKQQRSSGAPGEQRPSQEKSEPKLEARDQALSPTNPPLLRGSDQGDRRTLVGVSKAPSKRPLEGSQSLGGDAGGSGCGMDRVGRTGARTPNARTTEPGHVLGITTVSIPDSTRMSHLASSPPHF